MLQTDIFARLCNIEAHIIAIEALLKNTAIPAGGEDGQILSIENGVLVWIDPPNSGADMTAIYNLLGISAIQTVAQLRLSTSSPIWVSLTDKPAGTFAVYQPQDTISADDGNTIVVDSLGRRYAVGPLASFLTSPFA